jgi:hypothetical protein
VNAPTNEPDASALEGQRRRERSAASSLNGLWLAAKLGTAQWVVAPRLTAALRRRGYELAISWEHLQDLQRERAQWFAGDGYLAAFHHVAHTEVMP